MDPYFATQRQGDGRCAATLLIRRGEYALYSRFAQDDYDLTDFEVAVTHLCQATGSTKHYIERAILGYARLRDLPRLRHMQARTHLLCVDRLAAIDAALAIIPPDSAEDILAGADDLLAALFTPSRPAQELPSARQITRRLRQHVAARDPGVAYDPKKRSKRNSTDPSQDSATFFDVNDGGVDRKGVELVTDAASMAAIRDTVAATARQCQVSEAEAAVRLLSGTAQRPGRTVITVYAPYGRRPGDPVFIPGSGWTNAPATDTVDAGETTQRPLDPDQHTPSYTPTREMRDVACARDGTCVFPGCGRLAEDCQLDHRIPFEEGGETTPANLYSLCQRHHNVKTDRRAFYIPDPVTGDIVWLFPDGTYLLSRPDGPLHGQVTPVGPHWQSSLAQVRANRDNAARFYAACHAACDKYETTDPATLSAALASLEQEYGLAFDYTSREPQTPPTSPENPLRSRAKPSSRF
ncbi:HNH endonuclease [Corynebacterium capitovis DSM 44611]|uniref:HNH endonuclease signature motif containing protein n=1 Tax=Corynebacterium capitovis TaxID=131081 RepID=UPI00037B9255|nr:HNH endonuclease signature motif containing protein [Corynebacterium capitovis]WKD56647.1 HNH endonuclease [Corynebacterium capitovis DSM 44611]